MSSAEYFTQQVKSYNQDFVLLLKWYPKEKASHVDIHLLRGHLSTAMCAIVIEVLSSENTWNQERRNNVFFVLFLRKKKKKKKKKKKDIRQTKK